MGIEHSVVRERRSRPKNDENEVMLIKRSDVNLPEAYGEVGISNGILKRIKGEEAEKFDKHKFVIIIFYQILKGNYLKKYFHFKNLKNNKKHIYMSGNIF